MLGPGSPSAATIRSTVPARCGGSCSTEIDDRLARALLAGEVRDGDTVLVGLADDGETLTVTRAEDSVAGAGGEAAGLDDDVIDAEIIE